MRIMRIYEWLRMKKERAVHFIIGFIILSGVYIFFHLPPKDFPVGEIITINSGESLREVTDTLYESHIIGWPFIFQAHVILLGGEKRVIAGDYLLNQTEGPADLAKRLVKGDFKIKFKKITIPEGWTVFQIADEIRNNFPNFDKNRFVTLAKKSEGYLFPETYFISSSTKPETIVDKMKKIFEQKVLSLESIRSSNHSLKDIMIMASIVELEAKTMDSRKIVSGILWKRLSVDMPLQVDSAFLYINGKNTYELTAKDLKIDSPYNTYLYKGLPPAPIGNPGLEAIIATLEPITTKYFYFLSEKDGTMHYAVTFTEHIKNKQKYLK